MLRFLDYLTVITDIEENLQITIDLINLAMAN